MPPKIVVCSVFRDGASDIDRMMADRLRWDYDHSLITHAYVEGDSIDDTYAILQSYADRHKNIILSKYDMGHPKYGSVIVPERMMVLGRTSNHILEIALSQNPDYILWLDSDVTTPKKLITQLLSHNIDIVAPMLFFEKSIYFRDTWGYRTLPTKDNKNGDEFMNRPRYCDNYDRKKLFEVGSAGQMLIKASVFKDGARFSEEDEIVGLCRNMRSNGHRIYVDPTIALNHPRNGTIVPAIYENNQDI